MVAKTTYKQLESLELTMHSNGLHEIIVKQYEWIGVTGSSDISLSISISLSLR